MKIDLFCLPWIGVCPNVMKCLGALCVQVHTLLKGLEKIAASADIPMLVAGDFNSVPGRLVIIKSYCDSVVRCVLE